MGRCVGVFEMLHVFDRRDKGLDSLDCNESRVEIVNEKGLLFQSLNP